MGKLVILNPGFHTTIQDMGRLGWRKYGVPLSGAMDQHHAKLANLLVNNKVNHPVLEITLVGPKLRFENNACFAITGASLSPDLDGKALRQNKRYMAKAGQVLSFGKPKYGARSYLAISGLETPLTLGSSSYYPNIHDTGKPSKGDVLQYNTCFHPPSSTSIRVSRSFFNNPYLDVFPGPEFEMLCQKQKQTWTDMELTIGENNRMGYHLATSKPIETSCSIITNPVVPGTVQLLPNGHLIALMRDAQVTGGYPRVLQLTTSGINQLSQKSVGTVIKFNLLEN